MKKLIASLLVSLLFGCSSTPKKADDPMTSCLGFGPQTPRDIDALAGSNPSVFSIAPAHQNMNLCNIHFHNNAEHKAKDFSVYAGPGTKGVGGGYRCNLSQSLPPRTIDAAGKKLLSRSETGRHHRSSLGLFLLRYSTRPRLGRLHLAWLRKPQFTCRNPNIHRRE